MPYENYSNYLIEVYLYSWYSSQVYCVLRKYLAS